MQNTIRINTIYFGIRKIVKIMADKLHTFMICMFLLWPLLLLFSFVIYKVNIFLSVHLIKTEGRSCAPFCKAHLYVRFIGSSDVRDWERCTQRNVACCQFKICFVFGGGQLGSQITTRTN